MGNIERIRQRRARRICDRLRARRYSDVREGRLEILDELLIGLLRTPAGASVRYNGRIACREPGPPGKGAEVTIAELRWNAYLFRNITEGIQAEALAVQEHRESEVRSESSGGACQKVVDETGE